MSRQIRIFKQTNADALETSMNEFLKADRSRIAVSVSMAVVANSVVATLIYDCDPAKQQPDGERADENG